MTPFVPLLYGAQAEIGYSLGGKTIENRLWFTKDNPPIILSDLQGLSDGLATWHINKVLPYLSVDLELLSIIATKWDDHQGDIFAQTHVNLNGGDAGKSYSANVMCRINFRWALQFRERKNANYVPGLPDGAVTGNHLESTFTNNLWNAYVDLIDDTRNFSPVSQWRWVVASAYDGGTIRSTLRHSECIGPVRPQFFTLGQSRRRLP